MLKIIQIVLIWLIFAFRSANSFTVCCRCCQQSLLVCQIPSLSFYFSFESSVYFAKAHWNVSAQRVAELMKTKFVDEHFQWKLHFTGQTNSLDSLRRSFRPTIELDSPNLFHGNVIFRWMHSTWKLCWILWHNSEQWNWDRAVSSVDLTN